MEGTVALSEVVNLILKSKNPVIYAGTGVIRSQAEEALIKFTEETNIPVITSAAAKGVISDEHPHSLGAALGGEGQLKDFVETSDLIIVIGSRFALRYPAAKNTRIIHIDIDESGWVSVNDILIEEGHAYEYHGEKKKDFETEMAKEKAAAFEEKSEV